MRTDKKPSHKADKKTSSRGHKQGAVGYSKKNALLEEAITHMNTGKYGRSSAALKELLSLDPQNTEARRLFATLHLRLGSLVTAREAFESLANEAIGRQDYWLAESLLREYLAAGPRCIPFLELLANVYQEKGDEMAAVAELGKAIEILLEDPDPDNPQKPAQLYGKIRELAPVSPVAFRFASSFDIQTGEFRIVPPPISSPAHPTDVSQSQPAPAPLQGNQTDAQPEVMPWEQIEEPAASQPSRPLNLPDAEVAEVPAPLPMPIAAEPSVPIVSSSESTPAGESDSVSFGALPEISAAQTEPALSDPGSARTVDERTSNFEWHGYSSTISESEPPSTTSIESNIEIPQERSLKSVDADETNALPSRMPWEHVADPALKIIETETPIAAPLSLEAIPASPSESAVAPTPGPPPENVPVSLQDQPDEALPKQDAVLTEASNIGEVPPSAESAAASDSAPSGPTSFSWNAIFDSAWKIAVGTTAPSSSVTVQDPEAVAPPEFNKELEPADQGNTGELSVLNPSEPVHALVAHLQTSSVAEPSALEAENFSSSPSSFPEEAVPPPAPMPAILPPMHEPVPEAVSSIHEIHESVAEPSPAFLQSEPEALSRLVELPPADATFPVAEQALAEPPKVPNTSLSPVETLPSPALAVPEFTLAPPQPKVMPDAGASAHADKIEPPSFAAAPVKPETSHSEPEPPETEKTSSHWSTGEVAVQLHRPSAKKKQWEKDSSAPAEEPTAPPASLHATQATYSEDSQAEESFPPETAEPIIEAIVPPPVDTRPEWAQASDSIVLTRSGAAPSPTWDVDAGEAFSKTQISSTSAASAVDVLFGSIGRDSQGLVRDQIVAPCPRPRMAARLARIRQNISSLIGSCFSTTRAVVLLSVSLVVLSILTVAVGIGVVALAWIVMEEPPSVRYQALTNGPQRFITDYTKNGYLLLLGFNAPAGQDPNQAGYERKLGEPDHAAALSCMLGSDSNGGLSKGGASSNVINGWFKGADPLTQLKGQTETVRSLVSQESVSLARYQQWLTMPFEDWGYGKIVSPNCAHILLAHRLFLLDAFSQDTAVGLNRLEKDMESWRAALGQSKTLMMKMLAAAAIQDDATMASSLLVRPETDAAIVGRLTKIVRPLDQLELSVRWPMQSHFVWATGSVAAELKKDRTEEHPFYVSLAAAMPLPVQRRANAYAEYYDAANKAVAEGRYAGLPRASTFVRTPASSLIDYWANPIEHIVGIDPLPAWDPYVGRMVETDAQLRLASLQAWVRRGPQDGDVLARLAKAGQAYYDPFTGLPMLVNQGKRLLYSVGMDGKDQEGDRTRDVVVAIPAVSLSANDSKRASR